MGSGWKSFWQLSKSERIGMTVLALLLIAWASSDWWMPNRVEEPLLLTDELAAIIAAADSQTKAQVAIPLEETKEASLFYFDINTIDSLGMRRLGLSPKAIRGVLRYRAGGGKVRSESDFEKLFSLSANDKARLKPWLRLEQPEDVAGGKAVYSSGDGKRTAVFEPLELNQADSVALLKVPGIGPAFAGRIVRYRLRLGGFVAKSQLLEVFGVDSARFEQWAPFIEVQPQVQLLAINSAEEEVLAAHPYLGKLKARRLVAYRKQHGPIQREADLYRIHGLDSPSIQRVLPYLSFEAAQ